MYSVPFVALVTDGKWLTTSEFYSLIEPDFWYFVAQDGEVIVCHFHLFVCDAKGSILQEKDKVEDALSMKHGTMT